MMKNVFIMLHPHLMRWILYRYEPREFSPFVQHWCSFQVRGIFPDQYSRSYSEREEMKVSESESQRFLPFSCSVQGYTPSDVTKHHPCCMLCDLRMGQVWTCSYECPKIAQNQKTVPLPSHWRSSSRQDISHILDMSPTFARQSPNECKAASQHSRLQPSMGHENMSCLMFCFELEQEFCEHTLWCLCVVGVFSIIIIEYVMISPLHSKTYRKSKSRDVRCPYEACSVVKSHRE